MTLYPEYQWRDLLYAATEGVEEYLLNPNVTAYIGFDPTASSLHIGSLLPIMGLARLQKFGHQPIAIAGGGTGLVGDPSGKTLERQLLSKEQLEANVQSIQAQLSHFLDFKTKSNPAILLNNADWLTKISFTDFMRDVGKHFTVNYMLAKESVKRRLESEEGISFTEFSYLLLQAYDYLVIFDRYGCRLQMGGSDQWGNIVSGIDLIRRLRSERAYGIVFPLVTSETGAKFGKSEAGAIWLDKELTSPYRFYQYWFNTDDRDVIKYLKFFTWLTQNEIAELADSLRTKPELREAQKRLAEEITRQVHGESELENARKASQVLFGGDISGIPLSVLTDIFADVPSAELELKSLAGEGMPLPDLLVKAGAAPSKSEARRLVKAGGLYLNNIRVNDAEISVKLSDFVESKILIIRKGKKSYNLVKTV